MLSAKKADYERICHEFGITDYRWMLKQLNLKKKENEEEQAKVSGIESSDAGLSVNFHSF